MAANPQSINDAVDNAMKFMLPDHQTHFSTVEDQYNQAPVVNPPFLSFKSILGESDADNWWRLYINPKDWDEAIAFSNGPGRPDPPGMLYDKDKKEATQPKQFRASMVTAYNKYLVQGALDAHFRHGARPLTVVDYKQLWQDCKPLGSSQQTLEYRTRGEVSFPGPEQLASDFRKEKFSIDFNVNHSTDRLDGDPMDVDPTRGHKATTHYLIWDARVPEEPDMTGMPLVILTKLWDKHPRNYVLIDDQEGNLSQAINTVFQQFQTAMDGAKLRSDQLRAIARAIRSLHILHPFTNGCGRCNVFTLLPLMLLRYGFGLPLGGQWGHNIDRRALDTLFNGGYTVEQIARYLWVVQDFGLENRKKKLPTCLDPPANNVQPAHPSTNNNNNANNSNNNNNANNKNAAHNNANNPNINVNNNNNNNNKDGKKPENPKPVPVVLPSKPAGPSTGPPAVNKPTVPSTSKPSAVANLGTDTSNHTNPTSAGPRLPSTGARSTFTPSLRPMVITHRIGTGRGPLH